MDVRTHVIRSRLFEKQLAKVPLHVQKKARYWILFVELRGIVEVMKTPGYHDEPLKGQRDGQRSVRLNRAYRLIYRIVDERVRIELLEVHKHDY